MTLTLDRPVVIPESFLEALHLKKADKVRLSIQGERIVLEREVQQTPRARLVKDEETGRLVIELPEGSAPITTDMVKDLIHELEDEEDARLAGC